jgi:hypothetical protein
MVHDLSKLSLRLVVVTFEAGLPCIEVTQVPSVGFRQARSIVMDALKHLREPRMIFQAQALGLIQIC